jgi:hypothetical protein
VVIAALCCDQQHNAIGAARLKGLPTRSFA